MENRDYGPSNRGRENDRDYDDDNFGQRERGDRWERQRERGRFFDSGDINRGYESDRPYRGGGAEREYRDEWYRGRSYEGRGRTEQDRPERGFGGGTSYRPERYSGGTSDYEGRRWRGSMERSDLYDREPDRRFSRQDYRERDYRNDAGDFGAHGSWDYASSSGPYRSGLGRDYGEREPFGFGGGANAGYGPSTGFGYGTTGRYIGSSEGRTMRSREEWSREGVFTGRGPKGYRRSDDRIREDVNERLTRHPDIDASDIDVRVDNCEVVLTGVVEDRRAKRLAEDIVEDVWGVDDVRNELKVRRGFLASLTGERADDRDVTRPAVRDMNAEAARATGRPVTGPGPATTQPSTVNSTTKP
jgi:hypothetical protein